MNYKLAPQTFPNIQIIYEWIFQPSIGHWDPSPVQLSPNLIFKRILDLNYDLLTESERTSKDIIWQMLHQAHFYGGSNEYLGIFVTFKVMAEKLIFLGLWWSWKQRSAHSSLNIGYLSFWFSENIEVYGVM